MAQRCREVSHVSHNETGQKIRFSDVYFDEVVQAAMRSFSSEEYLLRQTTSLTSSPAEFHITYKTTFRDSSAISKIPKALLILPCYH